MIQIHRIETQDTVTALFGDSVCTKCQRTWKYVSSIVICVFSDQIHASRRKIKTGTFCATEKFFKFFHQTFFHDVDSSLSIETEYFYKFIIKIRLKKVYKKYVHIYGIMLYNRGEEQIWGKERRAWNRHTNTPIK